MLSRTTLVSALNRAIAHEGTGQGGTEAVRTKGGIPPNPPDASAHATLAAARYHGLVPLLHQAFVDDPPIAQLGQMALLLAVCSTEALANSMWELAHRAELRRVLAALASAGMKPLLLKGTPLSFTHYTSPGLRPRGDTDLLLPRQQREAALDLLKRLGYRRDVAVEGKYISYQVTVSRVDSLRTTHCLDVHWRVNNSQMLARLLSYDELAAQSVAIPALGPHARAPGNPHALLFACMHRAGHANVPYYSEGVAHHGGDRLIWLYDIHLLLTAMSVEEREHFASMAADKQLRTVCREGLAAATAAFGTVISANLAQDLAPLDARPEPTLHLLKGGRWEQLVGDLKALDTWGERLGLLRENAFPGTVYMNAKYPHARLRWLPVLYARRLWNGATDRKASRS